MNFKEYLDGSELTERINDKAFQSELDTKVKQIKYEMADETDSVRANIEGLIEFLNLYIKENKLKK
jgi:hypothetical protein